MRVLYIEDSPRLQRTVGTALRQSGSEVDTAEDGEEGFRLADSNDYDVVIIDIMLPKRDGMWVLRELRRRGRNVHVMLLTARDAVVDRVNGLEAGADDYVVKPFALEELIARVNALGRRAHDTRQVQLIVGDLEVDTLARVVRRGKTPLDLTAREYLLLEYLMRRRGRVVTRSEIEAHLYEGSSEPMSNVVDSAISSLRKKLGAAGATPLIHTRRGFGYIFEEKAAATPAET
jgi:DNA-binding response OmpR family regulator